MLKGGLMNGFYRFGETVLLLFYVNLLWIGFTVLGLIIFGIGPSTIAMYEVFRKWSMGKGDLPVFQTFWRTYRTEFLKGNALAFILGTLGAMLLVNLHFFESPNEWISLISRYASLVAICIYGIMLIYIFPVYVHYENTLFNSIKNATLIAIYQPLRTIYIIAACFTLYHLLYTFSVFIFLFGASLTSMVVMWIAYRTFERIERKQELMQEENHIMQA